MSRGKYVILFIIVTVAALLRFYHLDTLPPSLEWDEVATGYDANSILQTGRDQYGNFLPISFRSLDDYKPPLYTYLTSISIAFFGWNDFAVRFTAALLGVLAVFTTYGLSQELFHNSKISLLAALFLAVSPWHTNFSRLALETNSTVFFTTAGIWAFLKGLHSGKWFLVAVVFLGLDLYLYHNARVFIPLLSFFLFLLYRTEIIKQKKHVIVALSLSLIFIIPLIKIMTSTAGLMRLQGTSIFTEAVTLETNELKDKYARWRESDAYQPLGFIGEKFHSEKVLFGLMIFKNYISHFNPTFWLFTSDSPRHHLPQMGLLYFIDLPLFILGVYSILSQKNRRSVYLVLIWMMLAPIPASITRDVPHALRSEIILPTFQIFIAVGALSVYRILKERTIFHKGLLGTFALFYGLQVLFFMYNYFIYYATDTSKYWQYGRREAAQFAESIKSQYDRIIVSTQLENPHIFFLYYLKYDPVTYLAQGGTVSGGWAENKNHFDKYEFRSINLNEAGSGKTLFIGLPTELPESQKILKRIYYLDGTEAIRIVEG